MQPQLLDADGRPFNPSVFNGYGPGQVVAYTGTSGYVNQPIGCALGLITSDTTAPADGATVTIGSVTYRFKATIAQINDVFINTTAANAIINLQRAINGTGTPGTDYFTGTVANPDVDCPAITATTATFAAKAAGTAGNSLALSQAGTSHFTITTPFAGGDSNLDKPLGQRAVLVNCSTAAYIKIGSGLIVAANTDIPVAAGVPQVFAINNGQRVAAVQQTAGGNLTTKEIL